MTEMGGEKINTPGRGFPGRNYEVGCIQRGEVAGCSK